MSSYCITFNICYVKNEGKIKIDYSFIPVELKEDGLYHSTVANEYFTKMKKTKKGLIRYFNHSKQIFYRLITKGSDDFSTAEKEILLLAFKDLKKKIFFRPKYKEKLCERVERILKSL